MRPVDRMTQAARAIGRAADFSRRLPEPPQRDELGRLAVTFNEMLSQLGEAFATQRRFLADASHELRTPLTVVRTNAEALQRGVAADPVERAETLRAIVRETDRMGRLVADLLALARADAGQPLTRRRLALDTLVLDVYEQEQALANGVHLDLGEWEQVEVEGDPDRLKQVVLNLVDNALRHTPDGGTVTLDLVRRGEEAVLRVRDTGPGIPAEQLGRIFERFYRVDQPRSRQTGGTGLGLAIAQEVAGAHAGRIEVESRLGAGSTFSLVLPVARPPAPDPAAPAPLPAAGARPLTTS
jgi:signal transduction histidine kinase